MERRFGDGSEFTAGLKIAPVPDFPQEEADAVIQADHFVRNGARGKNIPI
jgi:hypothetical protein